MKASLPLILSGIAFTMILPFTGGKNGTPLIDRTTGNLKEKITLKIDTPDQDRFVKVPLVQGQLFEPTEIAILPNLDILISQRRGEIMLYKNKTKKLLEAGKLDVYFKTSAPDVNAEEGLLGMAADPNFATNQFVYLFYSPVKTSVNRLSRFKLVNDKISIASEKVVLEFYSQREICCHTGGSIAFGPDGMLYVSTGDNSTPFDVPKQQYVNKGYAPLDNRPGLQQYDARRSSGNTNDLRGKVLRIKVNTDGTYSIPEGNLFPKDDQKSRPEIYVMGNRNPYRISVDQKTGFLYWGEVGPDANNDDDSRGPRGYDEINQARKAGNFGWPLFVGNNYPYKAYDYTTGTSGAAFDPAAAINNSPNNTGRTQLPPAQSAYIWYPYGNSKEFPEVGSGGRTAMAGPVYWPKPGAAAYPSYYNGKLIIYEWMRGWVKAVTMAPNGDYISMEPFLANISLAAPVDMELGPDGKLYILEYGKGWFSKNADAGLTRIDYLAGNRPPAIKELLIEKTSGLLPYKLTAKVDASDPDDGDVLTYIWNLGKGVKKTTNKPELEHTFTRAGEYAISVEVIDNLKASSKSTVIPVFAGNEHPKVDIVLSGNKTFYFPGKPVSYQVLVTDKGATVNKSRLYVSNTYTEGFDLAGAQLGHQQAVQTLVGKSIMMKSDCSTCHKISTKSIGPAFTQVSTKYQKNTKAIAYLTNKVIKGGSGVWGEVPMPGHATMKESDVKQIAEWIMSLSAKAITKPSLPAAGNIIPPVSVNKNKPVLAIKATYSDLGAPGLKPLTSSNVVNLKSNIIEANDIKDISQFGKRDYNGGQALIFPQGDGRIVLKNIDLTSVTAFQFGVVKMGENVNYTIEIRLDDKDGKILASSTSNNMTIPIELVTDKKMHDVYFLVKNTGDKIKDRPLLSNITAVSK
ncbi:PQQ-dependent sugar dehydrogenase [Pedobacter frigoris]|uniref:PQQ-dependent sugar dehydrogenase n=1 Tax=Pedobacter frigoris TaxID=2571272 RepID=UPI00292F0068|nr:PQQ-dependent sugar dehydrogenase [Pedobacter frigoris]